MFDRLLNWFRKGKPRTPAATEVAVVTPVSPESNPINVEKAETAVIGDHAQVNINKQITYQRDPRQLRMLLIGFGVVLMVVIALWAADFLNAQTREAAKKQEATLAWQASNTQAAFQTRETLQTQAAAQMDSQLNIAVAGFAIQGSAEDAKLGEKVGAAISERLDGELKKKDLLVTVQVWGPNRVGSITGEDAGQRAGSAEKLALKVNATIVVYGVVDVSRKPWKVAPEFYVSERNFYESQEITGQYQLGSPINVGNEVGANFWVSLNKAMPGRVETLTWVTEGISAYANKNYDQALELFQSAEAGLDSKDPQALSVLYLLEGNAALSIPRIDAAEASYRKSLELDGEYARARIGQGSIYYLKALAPFNESKNPQDIDLAMLDESEQWYQSALAAKNKPDQADIETKVHFNLGQCYFLRYYRGQKEFLGQSVEQFTEIINEYANDQNPRVNLWVGEAHARLALIANNEGDIAAAIREYEKAIALLEDYPERQVIFQERLDELSGTPTAP